ncbi:nuclear pore complex protein NUP98B-like [Rosa sericea]
MLGQTSSNTSKNPFGSTTQFQFGAQTSRPFGGASTAFAPFGASTAQTSRSFGEFVTTTQPSQPAPRGSSQFSFGTSTIPAFGQKFVASSSPFGAQSTTQAVGNTASAGGQRQGSRVAAYEVTHGQDLRCPGTFQFQSITAMQVYESKSVEELRFEDYQSGDKGGKTIMKTNTPCNPTPSFPFPQTSSSSPSPSISSTPATNAFRCFTSNWSTSSLPSTCSSTPAINAFTSFNWTSSSPSTSSSSSPAINAFTWTSSSPSTSSSSTPATNAFKTPPTPTPPFSSFPSQPSSNPFNTSNSTPPPSSFPSWTSSQLTSPSLPATFTFTTPTPSIPQTQTSTSTPAPPPFSKPLFDCFKTLQPNTTPGSNIFNPTQPQPSNTPILQQNNLVQQPVLVPATNPFGTPRATPQVSDGGTVQYGISSIPVVDRPAPANVRVSSLLTARQLVQRHIGFPAASSRRYDLYKNKNGSSHPKVPFFSDDADQAPKAPKIML